MMTLKKTTLHPQTQTDVYMLNIYSYIHISMLTQRRPVCHKNIHIFRDLVPLIEERLATG